MSFAKSAKATPKFFCVSSGALAAPEVEYVDPSKWLDWIKLPTKTLLVLCLVSGTLLFSERDFLGIMGLEAVVDDYRPYIGIGFLTTLGLTVVNSLARFGHFVWPWIVQAHWIRLGKKCLQNLTPEEKQILRYYIAGQTRSQNLPVQSGVVNALVHQKVITRGSRMGTLHGFDFVIQPWAWEYLNENPQLLE